MYAHVLSNDYCMCNVSSFATCEYAVKMVVFCECCTASMLDVVVMYNASRVYKANIKIGRSFVREETYLVVLSTFYMYMLF